MYNVIYPPLNNKISKIFILKKNNNLINNFLFNYKTSKYMIYCSLEDAWGNETINGQIDKYNYKDSVDNKKIENFDNTNKKKKKNNTIWKNNQKKYEKKSCDSYTLDDINEIYSDDSSSIEDSDIISDLDTSAVQPKETSFYEKKKIKNDDQLIKKLIQENKLLKQKIKGL